jgi:CheY-like chemotaxis protein
LRFAGATVETADSDLQAFERSERHDLVLVDDTPQIAHARTLAAKLVAPHRRVGLITSNRTSPVDFPPGCFRLGRPVRRRHLLEAMTRALTVPVLHPPKQNTAEPAPFVGLRVLVAEDNAINQRVIRGLLAKLGCHVHIAENGQLALDAMANNRWDIVFMDCQMPKVDGFEATRQARHTFGEQLPIIALTAGTMEGDRERCLASGMNDFLAKPVRPEDLRRMIAAYATAPRPVASTG